MAVIQPLVEAIGDESGGATAECFPWRPLAMPGEGLEAFVRRFFVMQGYSVPNHLSHAVWGVNSGPHGEESEQILVAFFGAPRIRGPIALERALQRLDAIRPFSYSATRLGSSPHFCPVCVRERRYAARLFDLPGIEACPQHACRLISRCVRCDKRLTWGRVSLDWRCACGQPIAETPLTAAQPVAVATARVLNMVCSAVNWNKAAEMTRVSIQLLGVCAAYELAVMAAQRSREWLGSSHAGSQENERCSAGTSFDPVRYATKLCSQQPSLERFYSVAKIQCPESLIDIAAVPKYRVFIEIFDAMTSAKEPADTITCGLLVRVFQTQAQSILWAFRQRLPADMDDGLFELEKRRIATRCGVDVEAALPTGVNHAIRNATNESETILLGSGDVAVAHEIQLPVHGWLRELVEALFVVRPSLAITDT